MKDAWILEQFGIFVIWGTLYGGEQGVFSFNMWCDHHRPTLHIWKPLIGRQVGPCQLLVVSHIQGFNYACLFFGGVLRSKMYFCVFVGWTRWFLVFFTLRWNDHSVCLLSKQVVKEPLFFRNAKKLGSKVLQPLTPVWWSMFFRTFVCEACYTLKSSETWYVLQPKHLQATLTDHSLSSRVSRSVAMLFRGPFERAISLIKTNWSGSFGCSLSISFILFPIMFHLWTQGILQTNTK